MWPILVVGAAAAGAWYFIFRGKRLADFGFAAVLGQNPAAAAKVQGGELVGVAVRAPGGFAAIPAHVLEAGPAELVVAFDSDNDELEATPPALAGQRVTVPRAAVAWSVVA